VDGSILVLYHAPFQRDQPRYRRQYSFRHGWLQAIKAAAPPALGGVEGCGTKERDGPMIEEEPWWTMGWQHCENVNASLLRGSQKETNAAFIVAMHYHRELQFKEERKSIHPLRYLLEVQ